MTGNKVTLSTTTSKVSQELRCKILNVDEIVKQELHVSSIEITRVSGKPFP